jgi:hypothetical protein
MRTTDPEPLPCPIVGERVTSKTPSAPAPQPKPVGPSGLVTDENGRLRTTTHPRG